jgi:mannose-6-phosphate isomerase-like protein (cupin superfamily)
MLRRGTTGDGSRDSIWKLWPITFSRNYNVSFRTHPTYQRLVDLARSSHAASRSIQGISDDDILLARLYCYAWRGHIIGTFHATQLAIDARASALPADAVARAKAPLADLSAVSLDPIADDFRALISTFHRYETLLQRAVGELDALVRHDSEMQTARDRFLANVEHITQSGGIACTRDDEVPAQSSFIVPNLGITIVPLVYGDHHSWNMAYLAGETASVPRHQHGRGVEIHLGFGKLRGDTLLAHQRSEVTEGYAMAIPPRTPHGFANTSGHDHYLPFVFGSRSMGGWGVYLDVEPQPIELEELERVPRSESCLNGLVYLDRQIELAARSVNTARWILVDPHATFRPDSGALVLSIAGITGAGLTLPTADFRAVSVVRGSGVVQMGSCEQAVSAHDHFGVPAGVVAKLRPTGNEPLVILDAVLQMEPPAAPLEDLPVD